MGGMAFYVALGLVTLLVVPGLVALAFSLLGFDLDWTSWKTYLGILLITAGFFFT